MMADPKIVFGMCLLSVAFVALGSAQETADAAVNDDGTATTWCAGFQKGIDATEDVDDALVFLEDDLVSAKLTCDVIPNCLGVKKNQDGSFTPRMVTKAKPNMLTEGIATSWLNKDKCLPERRCPITHPFAYDVGRQCCSTARGDGYDSQTNNWVVQDWTTRRQAWDSTSCEGDSMYCHAQPGSDDYDEETFDDEPCENFKVVCEADADCAAKDVGYGQCVGGVCTTMCTDTEFQCEVSKMCIDKPMKCNGTPDCAEWYGWSWVDSSDEDTCDTTS